MHWEYRFNHIVPFSQGARQIYQTLNYSIDIAIGKRAMQWMMKLTRKRKMNEESNYRGTVRIPETPLPPPLGGRAVT